MVIMKSSFACSKYVVCQFTNLKKYCSNSILKLVFLFPNEKSVICSYSQKRESKTEKLQFIVVNTYLWENSERLMFKEMF